MARYNEILVGRFNRGLQKLVGIKAEPPSPQLASEIQPTIQLPLGVEYRYLDSWQQFAVTATVAAVAAQEGVIRFRNPVGSNVIAVFEGILLINRTATATDIVIERSTVNSDETNVQSTSPMRLDARGIQAATVVVSTNTIAAASLNLLADIMLAVNSSFQVIVTDDQEIPLLPGDVLRLRNNTVNLETAASVRWRERFLEESERT